MRLKPDFFEQFSNTVVCKQSVIRSNIYLHNFQGNRIFKQQSFGFTQTRLKTSRGFFFSFLKAFSSHTVCLQFLDYNIALMSLFECRILKYLQRTLCASSMVVDRALGRLGIFPGVG